MFIKKLFLEPVAHKFTNASYFAYFLVVVVISAYILYDFSCKQKYKWPISFRSYKEIVSFVKWDRSLKMSMSAKCS